MPTATHHAEEVHETPDKVSPTEGETFGLVTGVHIVPFQDSINVEDGPDMAVVPTAIQVEGALHDTAFNPPGTVFAGTTDQVSPFQDMKS